ncbi:MAG: hypothetical protein LBU89_04455 [Fibromonadaceae bacterium]|jgi:hypothetical protein|nr:hypothetical protein [Fibromonadaceae bacterium]
MVRYNNKQFDKIVTELKPEGYFIGERAEIKQSLEFLPQWLFFAAVALIPSVISYLRIIRKDDIFGAFFLNHQILYVGFTLALALFIEQVQKTGFRPRHFIYLFMILIGLAFYILLDNEVSFNLFSEYENSARNINFLYLISVLAFGFGGYLPQNFFVFFQKIRRK